MNLLRSFRWRLTLGFMAGATITVFAALGLTWTLVRAQTMRMVDDSLDAAMTRLLALPLRGGAEEFSEQVRNGLTDPYGAALDAMVLNKITNEVLFTSEKWPVGILPTTLPSADVAAAQAGLGTRKIEIPSQQSATPSHTSQENQSPKLEPEGVVTASKMRAVTISTEQGPYRVGIVATKETIFAGAFPLAREEQELARLGLAMLAALPVALLLSAAAGLALARRALAPINALSATVERITSKGLYQRVKLRGEAAEFQRLIELFNNMMNRLESSFEETQRFTADAAHELRTPLTVLQGRLEQRLQNPKLAPEEQAFIGGQLEEIARLKDIMEKLLLLSLSDANALKVSRKPVDIAALAADLCDDARLLDPARHVSFARDGDATVLGDRGLLVQVVQNLVSNALRYSPADTAIGVAVGRKNGDVILRVTNTGNGIPPQEREAIFDRFHRLEKSRSRAKGGAGLGLSLAREIARAHGGELSLTEGAPERITFELRLPKA